MGGRWSKGHNTAPQGPTRGEKRKIGVVKVHAQKLPFDSSKYKVDSQGRLHTCLFAVRDEYDSSAPSPVATFQLKKSAKAGAHLTNDARRNLVAEHAWLMAERIDGTIDQLLNHYQVSESALWRMEKQFFDEGGSVDTKNVCESYAPTLKLRPPMNKKPRAKVAGTPRARGTAPAARRPRTPDLPR